MRAALFATFFLFVVDAHAGDRDAQKASVALIRAVGEHSVICYLPSVEATQTAPMTFYAIRNLAGELTVALDGGAVTSTETGFFVYVRGDQLFFDVGDDAPSDIFRFSLKDLRAAQKPGSRARGWFYLSDRDPREGEPLECYIGG